MNFVQIVDFDWLPWQRNVKCSKKYSKIFFSEVIMGDEAEACKNVCVIILYINYVFYCSCACGFVAMATLSFHRFESRPLFLSDFRYFDKSFTVMFLE